LNRRLGWATEPVGTFLEKTDLLSLLRFDPCSSMQKWQNNIKVDLKNKMGECGLDSSGSGLGDMRGSCDNGNELSGSISA